MSNPEYIVFTDSELEQARRSYFEQKRLGKECVEPLSKELFCRLIRNTMTNMISIARATEDTRYPSKHEVSAMAKRLVEYYPMIKGRDGEWVSSLWLLLHFVWCLGCKLGFLIIFQYYLSVPDRNTLLKSSWKDSQMSKVQRKLKVLLPKSHDRMGIRMLQQVTTMAIPVHQLLYYHLPEPAPQCNTRIAVMKHVCIALIHCICLWAWGRGTCHKGEHNCFYLSLGMFVFHAILWQVTHMNE